MWITTGWIATILAIVMAVVAAAQLAAPATATSPPPATATYKVEMTRINGDRSSVAGLPTGITLNSDRKLTGTATAVLAETTLTYTAADTDDSASLTFNLSVLVDYDADDDGLIEVADLAHSTPSAGTWTAPPPAAATLLTTLPPSPTPLPAWVATRTLPPTLIRSASATS